MSRCAAVLLLVGCAEPVGPPAAEPEPVVTPAAAAVPAEPPAAITLAERIRQEGWLVRFWEQLTPAQRRRVAKQLRQGAAPAQEAEAAATWDGLGLPERDALVFGAGLPRARAQP